MPAKSLLQVDTQITEFQLKIANGSNFGTPEQLELARLFEEREKIVVGLVDSVASVITELNDQKAVAIPVAIFAGEQKSSPY